LWTDALPSPRLATLVTKLFVRQSLVFCPKNNLKN
jgi:hypothetical protein